MEPGKFITLEGAEGVGKSTNLEFLKAYFDARGIACLVTREPGGTQLGEKIRTLLLSNSDEKLDATAELLLIFAARAQHLERVIRPALSKGTWVLCDRFTDATFAYQGAGRGIKDSDIRILQKLVQHTLHPDLTLILDLDPAIGMSRAKQRATLDRFEQEQLNFFERVRAGYLGIAEAEPARCAVIDASQPLEVVKAALLKTLVDRLALS